MKTKLLLLSCLIAVLQGCMFQSADIIANENIDINLREAIKAKNDSVIEAMRYGKMKIWKAIGSENFVKHLQSNVRTAGWAFRNGYLKDKYDVFDEYQCSHSVTNNNIAIPSEVHAYTFNFVNEVEETYVSLLSIPYREQDYLLAVIYGKEGGQWKLNEVKVNAIGYYSKNAQDFYTLAKQKEEQGYLFDAYNYADIANSCVELTGTFIGFDDAKSIPLYKDRLKKKIDEKYKFAKVLDNIRSKPYVESIAFGKGERGPITYISYATHIPLEDGKGRQKEFEQIKKEVKKEFKDVDFNKYETVYRVYSASEADKGPNYRRYYYDFSEVNYDFYKNID